MNTVVYSVIEVRSLYAVRATDDRASECVEPTRPAACVAVVAQRAGVRRSVEVEYWVVDDEGRLTEPGSLADLPGTEREFVEPLLEVKTTPCSTADELRKELFARVRGVLRRADDVGKHLVPLGTPLGDEEVAELPSERTRVQNRVVGPTFRHVRHCAGTHVHVEQSPGREIDQLNTLVALDPALALLNSSPYYRGERLADGARSRLYRRLAYEGIPHQGRLWRYVDDRREWDRRLERRYEAFVTMALEAGVDRLTVEEQFSPESAIWTPVQLREAFGTVEWRSPDAALPSQVVRVADHLASVAARIEDRTVRRGERGRVTEDEVVLPPFETVLEHVESAIEEGLGSPSLRAYLDRMGFDVEAYDPVSSTLDRGPRLSPGGVREVRLHHAARLRRDVRATQSVRED